MAHVREHPISTLSDNDARALILRNHIGRLAFTLHDRVDIEPISYVADANSIYLRTSEGQKVSILRHHPWVAFEVDEINSPHDWQSVVVRGHIRHIEPERSDADREFAEHAIAVLRRLDPHVGSDQDAFAHRNQLWVLHMDQMTGRQSSAT